jgi:ankyrin repeat protein
MEIYKLLLEKGADIHEKSVTMTALERAKAFKNEECIKMLESLGAKY